MKYVIVEPGTLDCILCAKRIKNQFLNKARRGHCS